MKQKRKVKSLIFQKKDFNEGLLSALLLILWVVLCLCSATLMTTTSVWAAWLWKPLKDITYSWMDDKVEVLYNLQFSMPNNLSGVVGEMYTVNNNDFYITSTPLTVNLNQRILQLYDEVQIKFDHQTIMLLYYDEYEMKLEVLQQDMCLQL